MASILKVDTIQDQSGNNIINENADTITIGASGDTVTIPSGATLDASSATVTIPAVNLTTGVTGTLPVANGGTNLASGFANGITEADQWRLTVSITSNTDPISSNLERVDTAGQGTLGTGMTVSSGRFSFPTTGIWLVRFIANGAAVADDNVSVGIKLTVNNSSYSTLAEPQDSGDGSSTGSFSVSGETLVDVTDISNVKVSFFTASMTAGSSVLGSSTINYTAFTFIRLGDT
jgi:hypothetical protein